MTYKRVQLRGGHVLHAALRGEKIRYRGVALTIPDDFGQGGTKQDVAWSIQTRSDLRRHITHCVQCGERFADKRAATLEHILPLWLGGENAIENVTLLCLDCNKQRSGELCRAIRTKAADIARRCPEALIRN